MDRIRSCRFQPVSFCPYARATPAPSPWPEFKCLELVLVQIIFAMRPRIVVMKAMNYISVHLEWICRRIRTAQTRYFGEFCVGRGNENRNGAGIISSLSRGRFNIERSEP